MKTNVIFDCVCNARFATRVGTYFKTRDFILHDGRNLKRFRIGAQSAQAVAASVAGVTMCFSAYGVAQAAVGAATMTGIVATPQSPEIKVAQMRLSVARLQRDIATIRAAAEAHAVRVDQRQALLVRCGRRQGRRRAAVAADPDRSTQRPTRSLPMSLRRSRRSKREQLSATQVTCAASSTVASTVPSHMSAASAFRPERLVKRQRRLPMGGPFEAASSSAAEADLRADTQFRSLFMTWKKLDTLQQGVIAIPSAAQPVEHLAYTSNYGIRSDPFRGTAAMHAGVDIPGPMGTPVYATADGVVDRAGARGRLRQSGRARSWQGHPDALRPSVEDSRRGGHSRSSWSADRACSGRPGVRPGRIFHYEVRIDGHAVNPVPFLQTADYLVAAQDKSIHAIPVSVGGPGRRRTRQTDPARSARRRLPMRLAKAYLRRSWPQ